MARDYGRVWPSHNTQHRQKQTDAVLQTEAPVVYNPCMSGRTGATVQFGSDQGRWLPIHHRSAISLMKSYMHFECTVNIRTDYHHPKVSRRETVYKHSLDFSRQSSLYFGRSSECGAITGRNTGHRAGRSLMIAVTDQSRRAHNPECWCNSR